MSELALLQRRFDRERAARKEAERLLEDKSREVYRANERLTALADQLREQAEQTKAIVETAAEGIITYDADGQILFCNRSALRIFKRDVPVGSEITELFDAKGMDITSTLFPPEEPGGSRSDEDRDPIEVNGRRPSGIFCAEVGVSRVSRPDSTTFTLLIRDLTRRKKLESRLGQAQKMESIGQLAAGIAHEINTPIQFIGDNVRFLESAFVDLNQLTCLFEKLIDTVKLGGSPSSIVEEIDARSESVDLAFLLEECPPAIRQSIEGIERVSTIVRALKEFSQPSSDTLTVVDVNRTIENTLSVMRSHYRDVAAVQTTFADDLPTVMCLAGQFHQALLNILGNSVEAIAESRPQGGGRILIETSNPDDCVEIRITDNGPGISKSIQDRIFDPFFTTKEVGKGMGQGLAFVYGVIVDKHGGSINVQSEPDEGTTFIVRLPAFNQLQERGQHHANALG